MVTLETHQSQELQVPNPDQDQTLDLVLDPGLNLNQVLNQDSDSGPNAITVLTLLDKLVLMLDGVQRDQHNMEVHQVQMEGVVRGIQADMTKLSKSHSHTANTVSKLLDKSRKLSVTMKEVRAQMEKQGAQVKKLEANHAHLIDRNQFRVLIFQDQTEIPSSVFVKDQPPFPRDDITEEGEEPEAEGAGLHTVDLSSDEEAGLEAEPEDDWLLDPELLETMEPTRAEKLKRSSLKKVDSLKKAFSKQNIEKKMTKIGTKLVSVEQRQKLKIKSPISFSLKKPHGAAVEEEHVLEAVAETRDSPDAVAHEEEQEKVQGEQEEQEKVQGEQEEQEKVQGEQEEQEKVQGEQEEQEKVQEEQEKVQGEQEKVQGEQEKVQEELEEVQQEQEQELEEAEGVSPDYALSSTLPQDVDLDLEKDQEEEPEKVQEEEPEQGGAKAEEE